ncbi:unnamed protein product [Arctogadus glacialis]
MTRGGGVLPSNCSVAWLLSGNTTVSHANMSAVPAIFFNISATPPTLRPTGLRRLYSLSYMWYSGLSCLVVVLVGLLVSFLSDAHGGQERKHLLVGQSSHGGRVQGAAPHLGPPSLIKNK